MRAFTSLSTATALALVLGALGMTGSQAAPAAQPAASASGPQEAAGLIVTGRATSKVVETAAATALAGVVPVEGVTRDTSTSLVVGFVHRVPAATAELAATALSEVPGIGSVQPDYVRSIFDASPVQVDDPFFGQQVHLWDTSRPAGGYSTRAPAFWPRTKGSSAVRVAIIDTGRTSHPDLSWLPGHDFVDDDTDPTDPGSLFLVGTNGWHGTHVAGIVAARADNGVGVAGVAPGVSIVPVRVLDGAGSGSDSDIVAGILWAAGVTVRNVTNPRPVQVINMSLGGAGVCTVAYRDAIAEARRRGVVVVAAAGNEHRDAAGSTPGNCPGVVTVGATDVEGARASFSNYGAAVDISAPGTDVLSTLVLDDGTYGYGRLSGTSMSSPAVAGAAALLRSTGMSSVQVESALPRMVRPATSSATAGILDLRPTSRTSVRVSSKVHQGSRARVRVYLRSSDGVRPHGIVRVYDGRRLVRSLRVPTSRQGNVMLRTPRLHRRGVHRIAVVFSGGAAYGSSRSTAQRTRVVR